jgi:hypothetical protein
MENKKLLDTQDLVKEWGATVLFWWLVMIVTFGFYYNATWRLPNTIQDLYLNSSLWIYYAGTGYLVAKIPLLIFEYTKSTVLKRIGWNIYMYSAPAWFVILTLKQNWIFLAVEVFGFLLMAYGWYAASKKIKEEKEQQVAMRILKVCLLFIGGLIIWYSTQGILWRTISLLEVVNAAAFILGTWALARHYWWGWICYIILHLSTAQLMGTQGEPFLMWCQYLSIVLAIVGIIGNKFDKINKKSASWNI